MAYTSTNIFLIIFLLPIYALAQTNGTVPVGSSLIADGNGTSQPWLSPSGDFAFGFRQAQERDLFVLAIWYDKIPDQTIAWFLNLIDPVPRGSTLELNAQSGLVLRNPQRALLWNSTIADEVQQGVMNDTGNFILLRNDYVWLWESFQFSADTILPLQELVYGSVLISRKSETDFSTGRFRLRFRENGNLVLISRFPNSGETEYYSSQTSSADASQSGVRVIFDQRGSIYIRLRNNQTSGLTPSSLPSASDNHFRATLNFDGVFVHYYHPRTFTGRPGWTALMNLPDDICSIRDSRACGYNSICRNVAGRPNCACPEGYELMDPNDSYGNCSPNFTISCGETERSSIEDMYGIFELPDTDWPFSDYEVWDNLTEQNCRQACLQDCLCAAAISRNNNCWKKKLPLANGRTSLGVKAYLKYNRREIPPQNPDLAGDKSRSKEDRTLITVVSVLLGSSVFINALFIFSACWGFYVIYGKKKLQFSGNGDGETNLRLFTYKELVEATNGFKEELGRGSFAIVYKGAITMGSKNIVAVKKLDRVARDAEKEFRAEVNAIGQTHHKNLVRLLGFCDQGQHRLLVYEYMTNGTLASFLFNEPKPSWTVRTQIAIGIARGLAYLHEECTSQIIHCDIKPQNILLDDYYNARISDFGLAKLLVLNQSRTHTNIRGTKGYVAPEWFRNSQVTAKVDVYSFGVLLLEIISCRRCLEDVEIGEGENPILVDWAWDCFREGRFDSLVDNDLEALNHKEKLERFVKVGIWCVQEDSSLRPTMRRVSQMLEGVVEVITPSNPFPYSSVV